MKKILCLSVFFICSFLCCHAQRYYGQWTMSANGGYGKNGLNIGVSGEKYIGRSLSGIKFGFSYFRKLYPEVGLNLPVNKYLANVSYFYSFEKYMNEYFFLNLGGGIFVGAERIGNIEHPYGLIINRTGFSYGISITPQMEFLFRRGSNIAGFIEPLFAYDLKSRFDKFIFSGSIGVKYYF